MSLLHILIPGVAAILALIAIQRFWKPLFLSSAAVKNILILGVPASALIVTFLLPPFQGPDEIQHWQLALNYARPDAIHETPAFSLPVTLDVGAIPFNPQVKFKAEKFRSEKLIDYPILPTEYIYVRPYSYPAVWAASVFFPPVRSVHEALVFYYFCRILPLLALTALLYYINAKFELPCTALIFFTLPLVLQQSVIVTADTLLNLGTVAAILLFIHVHRTRSSAAYAALWILCLAIGYAKIIAAGVLFLPLTLLPFDKIPVKKIVLPLAVILIATLGYIAMLKVIDGMRLTPLIGKTPEEKLKNCNLQIASLTTIDGWLMFAKAYGQVLFRSVDIRNVSSPLGWLDTELNRYHKQLIIATGALAVVFDAIRVLPALPAVMRQKRRQLLLCLALIAGVFFFVSFTDSLIYFVIGTNPGTTQILCIQIRHLFPGIITALLLPLMLTESAPSEPSVQNPAANLSLSHLALYSTLLVSFVVLLFARDIELAVDLLVRYW